MNPENSKEYLDTNIAGKLATILERIRSTNPPDGTIFSGWMMAFNCPKDPPTFVFEHAVKTTALVSRVYDLMLMSKFPKDIYEKPLLGLYETFSDAFRNTAASWGNLRNSVSDDKLSVIKTCAAVLHNSEHRFSISNSELDRFLEETKKLAKFLNERDIHPLMKKRLLDLLQEIMEAANEFRIYGSEALREVFVKACGEITGWDKELNKEPNTETRNVIYEYLKIYGTFVSALKATKELLEGGWEFIQQYLPAP